MVRPTRVALVCALAHIVLLYSSPSWADDCRRAATGDICSQGSPWSAFTQLRLTLRADGDVQTTTVRKYGAEDFSVDVDDGSQTTGRMIVLAGRALLMKDVPHERGYEIDALDGPALLHQLVVTLLDQAFPGGPMSVGASAPVKMQQPARAIQVSTPSADLRLAAPWSLSGTAHRSGDSIDYDLEFVFDVEGSKVAMLLAGSWQKASTAPALDDQMTLEGWMVFWLTPMSSESKEGTILDFGAKPAPGRWADLRALRKYLADESRGRIR
jgi:hypothetical protein